MNGVITFEVMREYNDYSHTMVQTHEYNFSKDVSLDAGTQSVFNMLCPHSVPTDRGCSLMHQIRPGVYLVVPAGRVNETMRLAYYIVVQRLNGESNA